MLTVKEAAAVVRLTQWAIYRAIQRGELTAYKPSGRLRIHEVDLDAWLESTRIRTETPSASRPARLIPAGTLSRTAPTRAATDSLRARVRASRGKRTAA
jgi:excisionase family DNA binding protein